MQPVPSSSSTSDAATQPLCFKNPRITFLVQMPFDASITCYHHYSALLSSACKRCDAEEQEDRENRGWAWVLAPCRASWATTIGKETRPRPNLILVAGPALF